MRVIEEIGADVIALQEVHSGAGDGLGAWTRRLGYELVEGATLRRGDQPYGNALLSRHPVTGVRRLDLSMPDREPRGALDAVVSVSRRTVRVVTTHLGLGGAERRRQVDRLLDHVGDGPVVLLGDLNEWWGWGRSLRRLRRAFSPTMAPASFPAHRPMLALDRILVRPPARLTRLDVHASPLARMASDHLPVVARLDLDR